MYPYQRLNLYLRLHKYLRKYHISPVIIIRVRNGVAAELESKKFGGIVHYEKDEK